MMMILPSNDIIFTLEYQTLQPPLHLNIISQLDPVVWTTTEASPLSSVCVSTFLIEFFLFRILRYSGEQGPPPHSISQKGRCWILCLTHLETSCIHIYAICGQLAISGISIDFAQLFCVHRQNKMCRIPFFFVLYFSVIFDFSPPAKRNADQTAHILSNNII